MAREVVLVSLVGHQPLPLLLAIRHIKPTKVIFLYSNAALVKQRKDNLIQLLPAGVEPIDPVITVDPWYMRSVPDRLQVLLEDCGLQNAEIICDLTGGTKAMAIGLAEFAAKGSHRVIYLESDSSDPLLQQYKHQHGQLQRIAKAQPVACELSIADFLKVYLGNVSMTPVLPRDPNSDGALFEAAIRAGFEYLQQNDELDEICYAIKPMQSEEIDLILRRGHRLAIVECKQGKEAGSAYGLLQLNNLASERYLGTYTGKILAVALTYPPNNVRMAEAHGVHLLEFPLWQKGNEWSNGDLQSFRKAVKATLG